MFNLGRLKGVVCAILRVDNGSLEPGMETLAAGPIRIIVPYTSVNAKRSIRVDAKRIDITSVGFPVVRQKSRRCVHVISAAEDKLYRRCCISSNRVCTEIELCG